MLTGIRLDATFSVERDLPCSSLEYIFIWYYRLLANEFKCMYIQSKETKIEMNNVRSQHGEYVIYGYVINSRYCVVVRCQACGSAAAELCVLERDLLKSYHHRLRYQYSPTNHNHCSKPDARLQHFNATVATATFITQLLPGNLDHGRRE